MGSPTPPQVAAELKRVVERWHQLPLDHALSHAPGVHDVVQRLADRGAPSTGRAAQPVPELGPAALMDQLTVVVHDLFATEPAAAVGGPPDLADPAEPTHSRAVADVLAELTGIRRRL